MEEKEKKKMFWVLFVLMLIVLVVIGIGFYLNFFQFNKQDVRDYISEEANKYPEASRLAAYKVIKDGVEHILSERNLTQQVITTAKANGTPREMELVHAAVMAARNFGYLATV